MRRVVPGSLITGAPRSGTKYLVKVLREHGVDAYHEERGTVTVSWMEAFNAPSWGHRVIHLVRNPLHAIASMMTVHEDYLRRYIPGPYPSSATTTPLERRAIAWLRLTTAADIAAGRHVAPCRINVEHAAAQLGVTSRVPTDTNTRTHKAAQWIELLAFDCGDDLAAEAQRYGYDFPKKGAGK